MQPAQRIDSREYYRSLLSATDIASVAEELLPGRVTERTPTELICDCPRHESTSKRSLRVSLQGHGWMCFGCRTGGDAIHLVEFVHEGTVSKGKPNDAHRRARDFLAARIGMPPLSKTVIDPKETELLEARREEEDRVFGALTALARRYHEALTRNPEVLGWVRSNYGLSDETLARYLVGWADEPHVFDTLTDAGFDVRAVASTGAFSFDSQDRARPFFRKRVIFPYWSGGRVVYLIGRRTPWSANDSWEAGKYHKLPVKSEAHAYVSPCIDNGVLWGEDILSSRPKAIVLAEGVTDALASTQVGFPTLSPVAVRLKKEDVTRLVKRLAGVQTVYLVPDSEVSGVGVSGFLDVARELASDGVSARMVMLPPGPEAIAAREAFATLLGPELLAEHSRCLPAERGVLLRGRLSSEQLTQAEKLISKAKVDLCSWLKEQGAEGTPRFLALLESAPTPLRALIDAAEPDPSGDTATARAIAPILLELSRARPAEQRELLQLLHTKTKLSTNLLEREMRACAKEAKGSRGKKRGESPLTPAPRAPALPASAQASNAIRNGTAVNGAAGPAPREAIKKTIQDCREAGSPVPWDQLAEYCYAWIEEAGGRFLVVHDEPVLLWQAGLYSLSGRDQGSRDRWLGIAQELFGLVPTTTGPRTFYVTLSAMASRRGRRREAFPWAAWDYARPAAWISLGGDGGSILRIDSDGLDVMANGANVDEIVLRSDPKLREWTLDLDALPKPSKDGLEPDDELDDLLDRYIGRYLSCPTPQRKLLLDWVCCFPLLGLCGARPMARLEGPAASGKTWAAKLITTLIYGHDTQKRSTDAANYSDASRNPLVALDNIETRSATPALLDFLLTAVTGITREKRASTGGDSAVVSERASCLVLTTGIEPLGGEFEEILTRTLCFVFDTQHREEESALLERSVLAELEAARPMLLTRIADRCARVLRLVKAGAHQAAVGIIRRALGPGHPKARLDEYLALAYLQRVAAAHRGVRDLMLSQLDPPFQASLQVQIETTGATARDASPVAMVLQALMVSLREGGVAGDKFGLQIHGEDQRTIRGAPLTLLFLACQTAAKLRGTRVPFANAAQFERRLTAALPLLAEHGLKVLVHPRQGGSSMVDVEADPLAWRGAPDHLAGMTPWPEDGSVSWLGS